MDKFKKIISVFAYTIAISTVIAVTMIILGFDVKVFNRVILDKVEYDNYLKLKKIIVLKNEIDKKYYKEVDEKEVIEGSVRGLFALLPDGYSRYLSKDELEQKSQKDEGENVGIGIQVSRNKNKYYEVVSVTKGRPADKAGLKVGDILVSANEVPFNDESYDKALAEIRRGEKELIVAGEYKKVKIVILRNGEEIEFMVGRDILVDKSVEHSRMGNIGYIKLSGFIETTYEDYEKAIDEFYKDGIDKLIIDVRNNPGGLVDEAVKICGSIIGKDKNIYYTSSKNSEIKEHFSRTEKKHDFKIVVLVNENSASASELLIGALKDYKSATLVGTTSYGKGIIQTTYTLPQGDGFQITTSEYLTPNKSKIHTVGIKPDIEIKEDLNELENKNVSINPKDVKNPKEEKFDIFIEKAKELLN